jgi:hypothetical protein
VCVISWRTVAALAGARRRGVSPSKPSSSGSRPNSGRIDATLASSASRPCSTSCSAAVVATALVIEALRNSVCSSASPAAW